MSEKKNREKEGKIWEKEGKNREKSGKREKSGRFFHLSCSS